MQHIAVIGAGTMGNGIAHVFAQRGVEVVLVDLSTDRLEKAVQSIALNLDRQAKKGIFSAEEKAGILARITTSTNLERGTRLAELVVEAASEDFTIKRDLFLELDRFCPPTTILATNTSSLSITALASCTKRPEQVIGMHFMNPVPVMKLVEVIRGYRTSDEVCSAVMQLSRQLGKDPVEVNDYPGFIANRILMPMINEAVYALYEGVAGVEEIDTVMRTGMAHPMGPLQLADFIGLDVCLSILRVLQRGFGHPKYAPCPLLVNMVEAGMKGVKSGEGFYTYEKGYKDFEVSSRFKS
jgi:3-hydroxybutyryl-CoA dehydrogenase